MHCFVAESVIGRHFATPSGVKRHRDQEQIQMIATAIGTPRPNAPIMASANSESRFAWGRAAGNDMAFLPQAPTSLGFPLARPRMNNEYRLRGHGPGDSLYTGDAEGLWLTAS
jgi:hypothetical protein